jgi:DNA uptake protein ComE-like DNA-binding protein
MAQTPTLQPVPTQQATKGNPSAHIKNGLLNVNKATHGELTALGLSDAASDGIIQARPFHKAHDLLTHKILNEEEYSTIKDKIYIWWPTRGAMTTR